MENKHRSSWGWFWQSVTGIALILLVGVHMIANHFVAVGGLRDYAEVVAYLSSPIIVVVELSFLVVVSAHAMLGVRSILFDLGLSARSERLVSAVCAVVGVGIVLYGIWLTYTIISQGNQLTALAR